MTEYLIQHIQWAASYAHAWGFLIILILMAIESSFLPLPSEVVMIPAGFLAIRGELSFGNPILDLVMAVFAAAAGSLFGALFNYYFALILGRSFLHKYGHLLLIKPKLLDKAESIFREYGNIATFIGRFIPGIRHLISLPAGISKMSIPMFASFTALGAGLWSAILAIVGYYLGSLSKNMTYTELVYKGKDLLVHNYIWLSMVLLIIIVIYGIIHYHTMKKLQTKKC